jgi:hypothetical protein
MPILVFGQRKLGIIGKGPYDILDPAIPAVGNSILITICHKRSLGKNFHCAVTKPGIKVKLKIIVTTVQVTIKLTFHPSVNLGISKTSGHKFSYFNIRKPEQANSQKNVPQSWWN